MPFEAQPPGDSPAYAPELTIAMPGELADALAAVLTIAKRHIEYARKIRAVQLAWLDAGANPLVHQQAQTALHRTWPVLATAVADLAGERPAGGRR